MDHHAANLASIPDITLVIKDSRLTLREDGSSYLVMKLLCQGIYVQQYSITNATPKTTRFLSKWNLDSLFTIAARLNKDEPWRPTAEEEEAIIQNQIKVFTPSTKIVFDSEVQQELTQYLLEVTRVIYINKDHKIYREDVFKRLLPTTLTIDPYESSQDAQLFGNVDQEFTL